MASIVSDDDFERRLVHLFAQGDFAAARELAEGWLARMPEEALAHLWRAQAAAELGDLELAESGFLRAAELRDDLAPAWVNLGLVRTASAKHALSVQAFGKARIVMRSRPEEERNNLLAMYDHAIEAALGARSADPRWEAQRELPAFPALPPRPLVSVIIPTCDRPALLRDAVDSALGQTHPGLEVVVVNDGGSDLAAVLPRDARLRLLQDGRKRGQAAARNLGVARSRGEVLCFLDDDDLYLPRHAENLVARLRQSGSAFAYADTRAVIEEIENGARRVVTRGAPFPGIGFSRARLHVHNHIHISGWAVRRPLFELLDGFDESRVSAEDWDLVLRAAEYCDFAYLPDASTEARIRARANDSVSKAHTVPTYLPGIYRRFSDRGDWLVAVARERYAERTSV